MEALYDRLRAYLLRNWSGCEAVAIDQLRDLPGGWSKRTHAFDAHITQSGETRVLPMILRVDSPTSSAILQNSRASEHALLHRLREQTSIPVPKSYFVENDSSVFGEPAMIIERVLGGTEPASLFRDPARRKEAESIATDLCEKVAALHKSDAQRLNHDGIFTDPKGLGITAGSWDSYMDRMLQFFVDSYKRLDFDAIPVFYDAYLHIRRSRPRPLPLVLVHGELNPTNLIYENGKVVSLVDWENAHIGDPREDLGWFRYVDAATGCDFFNSVPYPGGFLGLYNHLTGFNVTPEELAYFQIFGYANVAGQVFTTIKRRVNHVHQEILPIYLIQVLTAGSSVLAQLLQYKRG